MATYDLLMLAILVGLTLYGYFKGMAWQIAYVASFVVSYFVAVRFADQVAPQIPYVDAPANKFVAMLLIYMVSSFAVWTIFRVIRKGIDSVKMEGFDHQMGGIIGFGRGVLWCVAVTFFAVTLPFVPQTQKQQIVNSRSGYYIARLLDETHSLFPPEVHQVVGPYLARLGNELQAGQNGQPSATQPPAQPAPAWGQPANNAAPSSAWPATTQPSQPAPPAWPQASNQPAAAPAASNFGWPDSGASQPVAQPPTQAQPASWPEWN